jgi:hypothetical protein
MKTDIPKHHCDSIRLGNEIVYTCPLCPDYKRTFNVITQETKTSGASNYFLHTGKNIDGLINYN